MEIPKKNEGSGEDLINRDDARKASLLFYYLVVIVSTTIGIMVVFILNIFTPFSIFMNEFNNLIGVQGTIYTGLRDHAFPRAVLIATASYGTLLFAMHLMLKPIREFLKSARMGNILSAASFKKAKRRLINLPVLFIPVSVGLWIVMPFLILLAAFLTHVIDIRTAGIVFVRASMIGLVVSAIAYQRMETFSRTHLIPLFFPHGRLVEEKQVAQISIARQISLVSRIGNAIPVIILFATLVTLQFEVEASGISAREYGFGILKFLLVLCLYFFFSTHVLNKAVSRNISSPIEDMIRVLKKVRVGNFNDRVQVVSNDEIGYAGDVINEMTAGLADREKMRQSLNLAKEVQQNLLPAEAPVVEGFDIYGKSVYCDETGGDYFDFLVSKYDKSGQVGIVLGDVSGHGIASALLMATARGVIRQRSVMPGTLSQIITDINSQVSQDIADTGSFMTLFYLSVLSPEKGIKWVRAGHDPAVFYDPETDRIAELKGNGIAIGLNEDWKYEENEIKPIKKGQVILVSTDGIFEARNPEGKMFGRQRVCDLIRQYHHLGAKEIVDILFESLDLFMNGKENEDDLTMVVIKGTG